MSVLERPEISDLIVDFDVHTRERKPVRKQDVLDVFATERNAYAIRVVKSIPDQRGILDPMAVDRLLISAHAELQRLSEEFEHGRRVLELLTPMVEAIRNADPAAPIRVVDVGCGTGYVVRWLAANAKLPAGVEIAGADYNAALIEEGRRLASAEGLSCNLMTANAFELEHPATIFVSTGVIHHFRGQSLTDFLSRHDLPSAAAFVHFDFQPSVLTPIGAWIFHLARMREPLSLHDGIRSALRAHSAEVLVGAVKQRGTFEAAIYGAKLGPFPRAFHALVGIRPRLRAPLTQALGRRASRLELR